MAVLTKSLRTRIQTVTDMAGRLCVRRARNLSRIGLAAAVASAALSAGCTMGSAGSPACQPVLTALPATGTLSLIAVVPRTSAEAASWGLNELADLLPFLTRPGLELHVLYTQDSDDLSDNGGDGGPPQVVLTRAPGFPAFQVTGAPPRPGDPTPLSSHLYCERLATWQARAGQALRAQLASRTASAAAWANATAASLRALAAKPIPDTTGTESGVEIDASASIFAAAQVAQTSSQPTILFLGGLTALRPPSQTFRSPGRLVAVIRSDDPGQVLPAEAAWTKWVQRAGGTFQALSSNDAPMAIAEALKGAGW